MASDYGDEAGEKLFDWMLRMGQDASQDAIRASAERLKSAIRNLRGQIDEPLAEAEREGVREYARLNLSEFEELPDYASLREIIETRLDAAARRGSYRKGEEHGSARWATASEMGAFSDKGNPDNNIILTASARKRLEDTTHDQRTETNNNVLVVGGPGTGKTRYYVKPNLMQANASSFISPGILGNSREINDTAERSLQSMPVRERASSRLFVLT